MIPRSGIHTGRPGDNGIDGVINEDKLGLEKVLIQAKRYALDRRVEQKEVQQFAGAMNKVRKGVFITTASYSAAAKKCALDHEKAISLIDGDTLSDLMISHGVGVTAVYTYQVLRVDGDYFAD